LGLGKVIRGGRVQGKSLNPKRVFKATLAALTLAVILAMVVNEFFGNAQKNRPENLTDQVLNADLRYETLKDDAQILPNGDLRVKQRIRIFLNSDKTWHQLYQRYKLNATETGENPLSAITDVTVTDGRCGQSVRAWH
jgi:uncharacterized membrane protein YraQ (UPF0718 family)